MRLPFQLPSGCPPLESLKQTRHGPPVGAEWLKLPVAEREPARFWSRVHKMPADGCWFWLGNLDKDGYGKFQRAKLPGQKQGHVRSHRWAWEQVNGPVQPEQYLLHSCDMPACVRPDHLRIGTQAENVAECHAKQRHSRSRLTPDRVREVRSRFAAGERQADIAKSLGVRFSVVASVVHGRAWRWVA
jgi:hypothetical protein